MDRPAGRRDTHSWGGHQHRRCRCGFRAARFTSWTDDNPGRRFIRCPEIGGRKCWFWEWIDPEMCERSRQIIPGLLRRLNDLESRTAERTLDNDGLRVLLMQSINEVEELKARIEDYETAITEAARNAKRYMLLCIFLSAMLIWRFF